MEISDIESEARDLVDADSTSYPAAAVLRRGNNALENLVAIIINADGTWQFDDTNHGDEPVGTGLLVEAQESYTFAARYLQIEAIEILPKDSTRYRRIRPIDHANIPSGLSVDEYFSATGFPEFYDKVGDTIRLYPAPVADSVTLIKGLKVWFKRTIDLTTSAEQTTGTKIVGIATPFHELISQMIALPYAMSYKKDRVAGLRGLIADGKKELVKHYSYREKDARDIMTMRRRAFR